jgi:hypothetical protein
VQFQAQPREQAPADIAIERQLDVGLVAGYLANLVFVVVGIEEVGQGEARATMISNSPRSTRPRILPNAFMGESL